MKNLNLLFYFTSFVVFSSQVAMAGYESVEDYVIDMTSKGLPKVLVVGCGHLEYGKHLDPSHHQHKNEWCVDIDDSRTYEPKWQQSKEEQPKEEEPTWKNLHSDAKLDITTPFFSNLQAYRDKFDTVVLERNWPRTLNDKYTLYNAAYLLKEGGELIVDVHPTYHYEEYALNTQTLNLQYLEVPETIEPDQASFLLNSGSITLGEFKEELDETKYDATKQLLEETFERFGVKFPTQESKSLPLSTSHLKDMGFYLTNWGFTNVIPFKNAYQPWTKEDGKDDIKSAREGELLVATKGPQTTKAMKQWSNAIKKFKQKN